MPQRAMMLVTERSRRRSRRNRKPTRTREPTQQRGRREPAMRQMTVILQCRVLFGVWQVEVAGPGVILQGS
jgi:hypothetical protein